jgi:hypothetical protein
MSAKARFTKADVKRAVSGMVAAGVPVGAVRIDPNGNIEILPATSNRKHDNDEWADLV